MSNPLAAHLAFRLKELGVSDAGIIELLSEYPYDRIEAQLNYLPFRKARRREGFIVAAVRHNFSPPKEFYASPKTQPLPTKHQLDEDAKRHPRPLDASSQGHGASGSPSPGSPDLRMAPRRSDGDPFLQNPEGANW